MSPDTEESSAVLLKFMSAMRDWENKFAELFKRQNGGPEIHGNQARTELEAICDKYLTLRDRKLGRMAGPSAGYPPEFDPDSERIVNCEPAKDRKVLIETLWSHPKVPNSTRKNRYTMVHKNGEWRLDRKEAYSISESKWVRRVF